MKTNEEKKQYWRDYYIRVAKAHRAKLYEKPCRDCGKLIHTRGATQCGSCARKGCTAEKASHWQGGRIISNGYVYIYTPDHPHADKRNYVSEHRLTWEKANSQLLPNDWVIHHLNGIKTDNRLRNLLAMPKKSHHFFLVQQALQVRVQELESELSNQKRSS